MRSNYYLLSFVLAFSTWSAGAQVISTFAGTGAFGYAGDGDIAIHAQFDHCTGVSFDAAGNVYIADRDNNVVRMVNHLGVISTIAGTGAAGYSGDGGAATAAKLKSPTNIAVDAAGNVFVADNGNNAVRKITPAGMISTYAGSGSVGYSGDEDSAKTAALNSPQGIAVDETGNLFIADAGNHVIRMVDPFHVIHTIVGSGAAGNSGNGGMATDATFGNPLSIALDAAGNLYIADFAYNIVRKVDGLTGVINTIAGNGFIGSAGDGGAAVAASLRYPSSVSVDGTGNLFIADEGNNTIRKVTPAGIITTVAGKLDNGYMGDGGPAVLAELNSPKCVAVDGWGRVYIVDYGNNVIRAITLPTSVTTVSSNNTVVVYPNPAAGSFTVQMPALTGNGKITLMDISGRVVESRNLVSASSPQQLFSTDNLAAGTYMLKIITDTRSFSEKVEVSK